MIRVRDGLVSKHPFIVHREVLWGECDPAGYAYTPRFADYAVGAAAYFHTEMLADVLALDDGTNIGLPVKNMSFTFERFLKPQDVFEMQVSVGLIGKRTFEQRIEARSAGELTHFTCSLTRICVDSKTSRSVIMPQSLITRLMELGGTEREAV